MIILKQVINIIKLDKIQNEFLKKDKCYKNNKLSLIRLVR